MQVNRIPELAKTYVGKGSLVHADFWYPCGCVEVGLVLRTLPYQEIRSPQPVPDPLPYVGLSFIFSGSVNVLLSLLNEYES